MAWLVRRPRWWHLIPPRIGPSLEHAELLGGRRYRTVIDVGANVGQFAIWAQEVLAPERIVCVEPQPDAADRIRRMARHAKCEVEVVETALGASTGRATLHVTSAGDSSSVLTPTAESQSTRPGLEVTRTRSVTVLTGDDLFASPPHKPVLLKIDVQGSELDVLLGMMLTLERVDAVLVEVSFQSLYSGQSTPHAVVTLLTGCGFELRGVAEVPGGSAGWALSQADLLFERPAGEEG